MGIYDVIILVSNKESIDWDKIVGCATIKNQTEPNIIAIDSNGIVTSIYKDLTDGEDCYLHYTASNCTNGDLTESCFYNFYIINENLDAYLIKNYITAILKACAKKNIFIAVHNQALKKIDLFGNSDAKWESFSHETQYVLWEGYLKPYINAVCNNDNTEITESFKQLCSYRKGDRLHSLRSIILTPFIPFHLAYQEGMTMDDGWQKILEDCCTQINADLTSKLNELTKEISSDEAIKIKIKDYLNNLRILCEFPSTDTEKKKKIVNCIENFAACLEGVINFIEYGEPVGCQDD